MDLGDSARRQDKAQRINAFTVMDIQPKSMPIGVYQNSQRVIAQGDRKRPKQMTPPKQMKASLPRIVRYLQIRKPGHICNT